MSHNEHDCNTKFLNVDNINISTVSYLLLAITTIKHRIFP